MDVDDGTKEKDQIKNGVRNHLVPLLREKLQNFTKDLVESEFNLKI